MAIYSSRRRTVTHHEWAVPSGSNHAEFLKAYQAARVALLEVKKLPENADLSDDALWISCAEDFDGMQIVISFTTEVAEP